MEPQRPYRERRPDGRVIVATGSSGCGKTGWVARCTEREPRLLVWDSLGEWGRRYACKRVTSLAELSALVARPDPPRRVAAELHVEQFSAFSQLAWIFLRAAIGCLVVEELSDVTTPGKAPAAWGEIVRKSRHYGATVYALTQRPAESDKTCIGNAALIHCGRLSFDRDRRYMAACLDVPLAHVASLGQLDWIERNMRTLELQTGRLAFGRARRRA